MVKFKKEWLKILGVESEDQISKISEEKWYEISGKENLSLDFIEYFADKLNWFGISRKQKLSETFMRKFADKLNWFVILIYQKLSEPFIEEFKDFFDKKSWFFVSKNQKLSETFMQKFTDKLDWAEISEHQTLSEIFIEKNADKVAWTNIFRYQVLSPEFIGKHSGKNFDEFSRSDIIFERDIEPLKPCSAGTKRFLKFFKKDQLVTWNELLGKYHSVNENKNLYFSDIEWFIDEILC